MERNLAVKIPEELYYKVKLEAAKERKTLKQWVIDVLMKNTK